MREKWGAMSRAEKREFTKDAVEELKAQRQEQKYAPHNRHICCFNDARGTLSGIKQEVRTI